MYNEFDDLENELLFEQLCQEETENVIFESNINVTKIGAPGSKNKSHRNIMITGSGSSSHQGRMKVSKPGVSINRATSHNDYISIFRKDKNTIAFDGDLKDIKMNTSEYQYYENLFIRNENIIQLVKTGKGKYDNYVDDALIRDEQLRMQHKIVERDVDGNASIYKIDKEGNWVLLYKENIKGEKI